MQRRFGVFDGLDDRFRPAYRITVLGAVVALDRSPSCPGGLVIVGNSGLRCLERAACPIGAERPRLDDGYLDAECRGFLGQLLLNNDEP